MEGCLRNLDCQPPSFAAWPPAALPRCPAGISRPRQRPPAAAQSRGRSGGAAGLGAAPMQHGSKRQRLDAFVANPPPFGVTARGRAMAFRQQQAAGQRLSLSQVDPAVLAELPPEVQAEVVQQLQQGGGGPQRSRLLHRSRLGQQRDEAQAWQQRWAEEQQQRVGQGALEAAEAGLLPSQASEQRHSPLKLAPLQLEEEEEGAAPLPPAVHQFAELASDGASSASALAAALADCLQQLHQHAQAAADASPQPSRQGSGSSGGGGIDSEGRPVSSREGGTIEDMDVDLPPTQPVVLEDDAQQQASGSPAAAAAPADTSGEQHGGAEQGLQRALQALGHGLQLAAEVLLLQPDLEQLRLLLLAVQRLGRRHPWFAAGAGDEVLEAAQQRVAKRYGWRLCLSGLLEAAPAAEGGGA